jgi:hypothetical protein
VFDITLALRILDLIGDPLAAVPGSTTAPGAGTSRGA